MDGGDNRRASYVLMRSKADAELALALARENKTRTDAQVLIDKLRAARGPVPTSALDQPDEAAVGAVVAPSAFSFAHRPTANGVARFPD